MGGGVGLFEIKTPQAGFCFLNCGLVGFEKGEIINKRMKRKREKRGRRGQKGKGRDPNRAFERETQIKTYKKKPKKKQASFFLIFLKRSCSARNIKTQNPQ